MADVKVGYWAIRGLVEPIHMYLEYKGVKHEKKVYTMETAASWFGNDKQNLGIDFPNLPYIIDGDIKLSQSNAILKYLEKKHGSYLNGDVGHDMKLDVMLDSIFDIRTPFTSMCYGPGEMSDKKERYLSRVPGKLEYFDKWLENRKFLTGDNVCVADFAFWNIIDYNELFDAKILESHKNILRFKKDFESVPEIAAYLTSPDYKKFPINAPMASWGGQAQ